MAGLGQVTSGGYAKLERQVLEEDGGQVGNQNDAEQGVAEPGAAREISRPVAGVHVPNCHHQAGSHKSEQFAPEPGVL